MIHGMKRINLVMMMLTLCLGLSAQSMRSRLLYYLDNYTREEQNLRKSTLDSLVVDTAQSSIRVYANAGFKEQYFTDDVVSCIYDSVRSFVPDSLRTYRLTVFTDGHPIEQLVPNTLRSGPKDEGRMWQATYSGQPWVRNVSAPLTASKGLQGNHLAIMQSHGTYWKQDLKEWTWQRPHLFCTTEDLFSQTFVIPYIIPMLENAGAVVYSPRDRDWQNAEVIVDNDAPTKHGAYREEGHWNVCDSAGFAHLKEAYYMGDNPFRDGTARWAHTTRRNNHHAQITWTPDIPDDGQYAVYVSYQTVANSITDAAYTVVHRGVRTEFRVNQQMGGETWVYLGTFDFAKGQSADNCIELSNLSAEDGVVTADGIRLGSGRGNIARGAASADGSYAGFTTSGKPRWAEASMYYAQWAGMPDSVYNHFGNDNDYNNDMWARCETVSTLAGGSPYVPNRKGHGVPFELSVSCHTDAGYSRTGDLTGTLAICTALPDYYDARTDAGISRLSSYDLASSIQHNLTSDMKHWNWRIRQVWNRNYCETREPQIPSIILEMLSHQSFDDLCFGYNPLFKFDFSRSVYKSIVKYIAMMHKRSYVIQPLPVHNFAITLNDQEEATLADMRLGMEGVFLFGTRGKIIDPETRRNVWFTGGIWNTEGLRNLTWTDSSSSSNTSPLGVPRFINWAKSMFTGPAAGKSDKRVVICGSALLEGVQNALFSSQYATNTFKKWDLEFTEFKTVFGSFEFILDEVFDLHVMPKCGLILDPDYLERYVFEPFGRNTLDLDAQGTRDSKAIVLREISAMVLKSPNNHARIIYS